MTKVLVDAGVEHAKNGGRSERLMTAFRLRLFALIAIAGTILNMREKESGTSSAHGRITGAKRERAEGANHARSARGAQLLFIHSELRNSIWSYRRCA
jgi:hypothetical protein